MSPNCQTMLRYITVLSATISIGAPKPFVLRGIVWGLGVDAVRCRSSDEVKLVKVSPG